MKLNDYWICVKEGSRDYLNTLKTDKGKLNLFFTAIALDVVIEVIGVISP
jgi:hypothetical protein